MQHNFIKNFIACFILFIIIAQSAFSVFTQTQLSQTMTNYKTVERVSGKGADTIEWKIKL